MDDRPSKSGLIGSGALHAALLGAILIGFSEAPQFDDSADSAPIETITQSQFNQIMKGARDARPQKTPVEKPPLRTAETTETPPPTPEPPKPDTPPALRRIEETSQDAAPTPPPKPAEAPPPPPREVAAPQPPPPPQDAEIDRPKPRVEPKPITPPEPPTRPKIVEKPPEKLQPDSVAKFLEKVKTEDEQRQPARSRAAEALADPQRQPFDPNAIAKAIGEAKPSRQMASLTPLGAPNASAQRMSPSMSAAIDGWLQEAYLNCWSQPPTMPQGDKYVAQVRVAFNPDGSLAVRPLLVNPPSDPAWRAYAESAMRAVLKCNPLHVPPQYAPYFEQWRAKTVHFDPQDAQG